MAQVATYLIFDRTTEEAFNFYKQVFGTEFLHQIDRFGDAPSEPGAPEMSSEDKNLIMNIQLPILGGHIIMGTDGGEAMGQPIKNGNNVSINLMPDTLEEATRLYTELSAGGTIETELQKMFWGDHYASFTDKFGVQWMVIATDSEVK